MARGKGFVALNPCYRARIPLKAPSASKNEPEHDRQQDRGRQRV